MEMNGFMLIARKPFRPYQMELCESATSLHKLELVNRSDTISYFMLKTLVVSAWAYLW